MSKHPPIRALQQSALEFLDRITDTEEKAYAVAVAGMSLCGENDTTFQKLFEVIKDMLESREMHGMLRERLEGLIGEAA